MNILAFDVSTCVLNICIQKNKDIVEYTRDIGLTHSETLIPSIEFLLNKVELERDEINLVVCSKGPGSFTGLRIGMATAKGISAGIGCPYISVNTLDMLAFGYDHFSGFVIPIIDAKKKRVYTALYKSGKRLSDYLDIEPLKFLDLLYENDSVLLTGPDTDLFTCTAEINKKFDGSQIFIDHYSRAGRGRALLEMGAQFHAEGRLDPDDSSPVYIRKSDAELSLEFKKEV
jgi:tRNA threonylcarbamoyladenosine biosynthesis protein TsaB